MHTKYTSFGERLAAGLIDGLVFVPFVIVDSVFIAKNTNGWLVVTWTMLMTIASFLYSVLMHARYGQTLGKMAMKIKVVDVSETRDIGLRKAFLRDSVWIAVELIGFFILLYGIVSEGFISDDITLVYDSYFAWFGGAWFLLELITMLTNSKRRALHDFIAGTVVMKLAATREKT